MGKTKKKRKPNKIRKLQKSLNAEESSKANKSPVTETLPKTQELPNERESLTRMRIQLWFKKATQTLEVDIQKVSNLKSLNGLALNMLQKEDWIRRSPDCGDILFNMWQEDQGGTKVV
jgi:hypothetical protein